jgi:hypothetical protein
MTAPYYHDGSVATLQDAIRRMGAQQIGRTINDQDVEDISAFLGSLSSAFFSGNRMHNMNDHQLQNAVREQMPDAMGQGHMMQGQDHTQHMQNMNQAAGHGMQHSPTTSATEEEADTAHQHGGH